MFLAFAHMTAPVYLTCSAIPHSTPSLPKLSLSPWRNKVGVESMVSHGTFFFISFVFFTIIDSLFIVDDWQKLDKIYYPPRLAFGLAFEHEARGVAAHTDPSAPTPQLANRLQNIQKKQTRLQDDQIRGKTSFISKVWFITNFTFQSVANRANKPPRDKTIIKRLNRPEEPKAFNSNLASAAKRPPLPAWFSKPHPTHANLEVYVSHENLQDKKTAQTYWTLPYEIFLTGDKPKTVRTHWWFLLMFHSNILDRPNLSFLDPAVRPLTKKE